MAICGAKKRNGEACQKTPMKGKTRCRLHGGASKNGGAPKGNKNSAKHNIYSRFMTDDEIEFAESAELTKVDAELKLCKVQMKRALEAREKQNNEIERGGNGLNLDQIQNETGVEGESTKNTFKWRDYDSIIDKLIARIQSLTSQKYTLEQQSIAIKQAGFDLDLAKKSVKEDDEDPTPVTVTINVVNASKEDAEH